MLSDAVLGDRMRLQQVLLNLAGNAIKFTHSGEVEISVRCLSQERDAWLEFAVRDSGIGIPPADLERLFQPFAQGDPSMARRYGGTGLGLSICKNLVQMMGGQIWVESEEGQGTTVFFQTRLPLAKEVPGGDDAPAHVPITACAPLRILLAEDNIANQKVAKYILRERGHIVDIASDGKEAVRLSEQSPYDVILMDLQMPELNGLDATAAIRKREDGGRRIPIVAMTAHAMQSDRDRCLAAGMDGYLCKPVRREDLIETVEKLAAKDYHRKPSDRLPAQGEDPQPAVSNPQSVLPDSAAFDLDAALARLDGNFELFKEMTQIFFSDALGLVPEMRAAAAAGDAATIERKAHRLKGTLLYLGAEAVVEAVARVEFLARSGDLAGAATAIRTVEEEMPRLTAALRDHVPEVVGL